ncbi:aminotransferase class V [Opitutia bacterium SCGC AG-212-L18]|nr:aminotransferase class V [Opitutae bacterium SCGC AG-212-L18]
MPINLEKVRLETPGAKEVIHFNNAGASLPCNKVLRSVIDHLTLESQKGGYEAAAIKQEAIDRFYTAAAKLINAEADEIAYAESATRAWDMVFYGIPFKKGDRIITCASEYASNYIAYLQVSEQKGVEIDVVPNDAFGQVDVQALEAMMDERVKLISITHVPTNGGLINPAKAIGEVAKKFKVLYLLDACQSVGQMPIDVQEIGCDMLTVTGRKFLRGPRGTGFLYVRKSVLESIIPPFLDLHSAEWVAKDSFVVRKDAKRFESWERYAAGQIGLGVAIDYLLELGVQNIWERIQYLAGLLRSELGALENVILHDLGDHRCGIVTFSMDKKDPFEIQKYLRENKINISISSKPYTLLDMSSRHLENILRASVHYYNNEEEIKRFIKALQLV